jgi:uncharacterized protein YjbI with pentapeptide repeats
MSYSFTMKREILTAFGIGIIASILVVGLTSSIYGQANMTGGNLTGGNLTGGNLTGGNLTGGNLTTASGGDGGDGEDDNGQDDDDGEGSN